MATVTLVEKPTPQSIATPQSGSTSARDRAIAALVGSSTGNAQEHPVPNPSQIAAEDVIKDTAQQEVKAGQSDTAEVTDSQVPTKEDAALSKHYAVLARKEKNFRAKVVAQEQQWKSREAAISARETELESKSAQDLSEYIHKDKLKQNAYGVLSEVGVSYDDISQQALAAQSPDAQYLRQMREESQAEIRSLREELGKTKQTFEQQQTQAYQQALTEIRNEATKLVNKDPQFETIKATRSVKDVVELIERTFKEEGTLLSVEEAAEAVENHLVEEAMKLSNITKIKERLRKNSEQPRQTPTQPQSGNTNNMKTLTNAVSSTRPLSGRERALLAFKGELK